MFKKEHYKMIEHTEAISVVKELITDKYIAALEKLPYAWTIIRDNYEVVACCGAAEIWKNRAEVWFMITKNITIKELLELRRKIDMLLEMVPFKRQEAAVEDTFIQGHKWLRLLGFNKESGTMNYYFPNGANGVLYARVR